MNRSEIRFRPVCPAGIGVLVICVISGVGDEVGVFVGTGKINVISGNGRNVVVGVCVGEDVAVGEGPAVGDFVGDGVPVVGIDDGDGEVDGRGEVDGDVDVDGDGVIDKEVVVGEEPISYKLASA